jgi:hypothetical protein
MAHICSKKLLEIKKLTGKPDIFNCLPTKLIEPPEKPSSLIRPVLSAATPSNSNSNSNSNSKPLNVNQADGHFQYRIFVEREDFGRQ